MKLVSISLTHNNIRGERLEKVKHEVMCHCPLVTIVVMRSTLCQKVLFYIHCLSSPRSFLPA